MKGIPWWLNGKEPLCQRRRCKKHGLDPWIGKIPWRREWPLMPVFLSGEFHGQKSLMVYIPWVAKSQTQQSMSTMTTKRWKQADKLVGSNNNTCFSFFPFVTPTSVSTWALKSALYSDSQPLLWTIWIWNLPLRFNQTVFLCHTLILFLLTNFSSQPYCWLWEVRAGSTIKDYLATMLFWMVFVTWAVVPIHLSSLVAQMVKHLPTR